MIDNTPLNNSQKIAYLEGLVTGKAKDAILHFHCNGQFYKDALLELERKFGKPATILNAYIQQLLDHQPLIKGNPESYFNYTTFLRGIIRNLQHLEHAADLELTTNLPTLRPQSKWHTTKDPIMKGQVVWILENNSLRGLWPSGLVTEVYPGSDNIVRKCKLKTKTGETVKSAHQF